jgi:hypothetical protein
MAHIRLNTHPSQGGQAAPPVIWGAPDPKIRGPVVGTVGDRLARSLGPSVAEDFARDRRGLDIRPSIAITKARLTCPRSIEAIAAGRLKVDGEIVHEAATSR